MTVLGQAFITDKEQLKSGLIINRRAMRCAANSFAASIQTVSAKAIIYLAELILEAVDAASRSPATIIVSRASFGSSTTASAALAGRAATNSVATGLVTVLC